MGNDRAWAHRFYSSKAWQDCRNAYVKEKAGLCEKCLSRGLITPGTQVHHKIPITPRNIEDTDITLSFSNLCLLCKACHDAEHSQARYAIGADGNLIIK